jgi:1-phosphofructokinase family hexose kinase
LLLIITPNPALDRTMIVPGFAPGAVLRAERVIVAAGGKGLNVARAAKALATPTLICGPLGGFTGQMVAQHTAAEGLEGVWSWHQAGETRTCILVVDPQGGDATALNEQGPELSLNDWQSFAGMVLASSTACKLAAVSGSLPPGVRPTWLAALIDQLKEHDRQTIIDTSGEALAGAIEARPYGLKVNGHELGTLLGRSVATVGEAVEALAQVRALGIELACVTLGALGAVAANTAGCWWATPPAVEAVSSVGSGDSLLAGLASGLLGDLPLPEALALGACGTADALTVGGGLIDPAVVAELRAQVTIQALGRAA